MSYNVIYCLTDNYTYIVKGVKMSIALSVRLPEKLATELSEVARISERSKSFLIQKALEAYLDNQADLQISFDRLHDPTDPVISLEDMRSEIGI